MYLPENSVLQRAIVKAGGQAKLADALGVTQGRVSQWAKGELIPHKHFPVITKFGVTARGLFNDEMAKLAKLKSQRSKGSVVA